MRTMMSLSSAVGIPLIEICLIATVSPDVQLSASLNQLEGQGPNAERQPHKGKDVL
jgi:hypothetical protein